MSKKVVKQKEKVVIERPPIIVVMGHIDHGKSTLLDYIRKSSTVDTEAGGITQSLSAYEVTHKTKEGSEKRITFLDTPGHAAFSQMRSRGANIADIAILVVSAEDGVKQQTKEALESIKKANIPYIVAINKIDRPDADIEKTKQNLAENDIFVEGYGGDISFVPISAKKGTGIDELLDMMLLVAEMEGLDGDSNAQAEGVVIESHLDHKKGITATLVIKNGTLKKGMCIVVKDSMSPIRMIEDFSGKNIDSATFSSPIRITGWNKLPNVGSVFTSCDTKKEGEGITKENMNTNTQNKNTQNNTVNKSSDDVLVIPIIIKADVAGMIEAIDKEIKKIQHEKVILKIINSGAGSVTENDIKLASSGVKNTIVLAFNVKTDASAREMAERTGVTIKTFDVIYKLTEWLEEEIKEKAPKVSFEEVIGKAKIIRVFSKTKNKQVIGGKVIEGELNTKSNIKITRRENEIGKGEILGLQQQKMETKSVLEGDEFGTMIESNTEIAAGDIIEAFKTVEK